MSPQITRRGRGDRAPASFLSRMSLARHPGFTLLEVLIALVVVGALAVAGVRTLSQGSLARERALAHAEARPLLDAKLSEVSTLPGLALDSLPSFTRGRFPPPHEDAEWTLEVDETAPRSRLFYVSAEVRVRGATVRAATYLNRYAQP